MNYLSNVTLIVCLVYIATVFQCDGHKRHSQRLRRPRREWYKYGHRSYSEYSSKLRELRLLMDIDERLYRIVWALQQKKQHQPAYVPIYVPYFVSNNTGYNGSYSWELNRKIPNNEPVQSGVVKPVEDRPTSVSTQTEMTTNVNGRGNKKTYSIEDNEDNGIGLSQVVRPSTNVKCNIATIGCCRYSNAEEKRRCLEFYECFEAYNNVDSCTKEAIDIAVASIVDTYAPSKRII